MPRVLTEDLSVSTSTGSGAALGQVPVMEGEAGVSQCWVTQSHLCKKSALLEYCISNQVHLK